jgi:hypothetical protein
VEDVLLFGEQQGNFMVRADYWIDEDWSITGVLVPIFRPALLPRSGELALALLERIPVVEDSVRWRLHADQAAARQLASHPTVVKTVAVELPEKKLNNMQVGYRIGGVIGGQDVGVSYYHGRADFPVAKNNIISQNLGQQCNPDDGADCVDGLLETSVGVHYPRMSVYGFNMTGEIPTDKIADALNSLGYRLEVAFISPHKSDFEIRTGDLTFPGLGGVSFPGAEYDYDTDGEAGGPRPHSVLDTPFAKWTVGLDYTIGEHVYLNVQWVHGLADEFGAGDWISDGIAVRAGRGEGDDVALTRCSSFGALLGIPNGGNASGCAFETTRPRIADYLVLGIDFRFLQQKLLARLFTLWDLSGYTDHFPAGVANGETIRDSEYHSLFTKEGFSAVIFPELNYNFGNGLDLGAGALVQLGKDYTKFGDPAAGGSVVWMRSRFAF